MGSVGALILGLYRLRVQGLGFSGSSGRVWNLSSVSLKDYTHPHHLHHACNHAPHLHLHILPSRALQHHHRYHHIIILSSSTSSLLCRGATVHPDAGCNVFFLAPCTTIGKLGSFMLVGRFETAKHHSCQHALLCSCHHRPYLIQSSNLLV